MMTGGLTNIKKKSLQGVLAITSQNFILQIIAFTATFILTIFLSPSVFGIFYIVTAFVSFLAYFSDIGLAGALIQKKEDLTREDLSTTFTIQQILVIIVVSLALFASGAIGAWYKLDASGIWLLRALLVSFFISSLKTIPSVLLERKLDFRKLIIPQILETISYYGVVVILAWMGLGITSFTFAVLARGIVGLIAIYSISPWPVRVGISREVSHKLLRFGIPYQINSLLALLKDDLLTLFLGRLLPFQYIGYIGWAKKWADAPLRLVMDGVIRVTFPTFSRLQDSRETMTKAIEKTLFGLSLVVFPITVGMIFFIRPFVMIIPKYGKWEPALVSFYFFALTAAVASLSTPLTNVLTAMGKIRTTLKLMIMWVILTWILTVGFVMKFGYNGVSFALFAISFTIIVVVLLVKKQVDFSFIHSVKAPSFAVAIQAFLYWTGLPFVINSNAGLVSLALAGVILYGIIIWTLEKKKIRAVLKGFRR